MEVIMGFDSTVIYPPLKEMKKGFSEILVWLEVVQDSNLVPFGVAKKDSSYDFYSCNETSKER